MAASGSNQTEAFSDDEPDCEEARAPWLQGPADFPCPNADCHETHTDPSFLELKATRALTEIYRFTCPNGGGQSWLIKVWSLEDDGTRTGPTSGYYAMREATETMHARRILHNRSVGIRVEDDRVQAVPLQVRIPMVVYGKRIQAHGLELYVMAQEWFDKPTLGEYLYSVHKEWDEREQNINSEEELVAHKEWIKATQQKLNRIACQLIRLGLALIELNFCHGDLSDDNILCSGGDQSDELVVIDWAYGGTLCGQNDKFPKTTYMPPRMKHLWTRAHKLMEVMAKDDMVLRCALTRKRRGWRNAMRTDLLAHRQDKADAMAKEYEDINMQLNFYERMDADIYAIGVLLAQVFGYNRFNVPDIACSVYMNPEEQERIEQQHEEALESYLRSIQPVRFYSWPANVELEERKKEMHPNYGPVVRDHLRDLLGYDESLRLTTGLRDMANEMHKTDVANFPE